MLRMMSELRKGMERKEIIKKVTTKNKVRKIKPIKKV